LSNLFTTVIATTNPPILLGVGTVGGTTATNVALSFTPGSVTFFTNHTLVYLPVSCPVNPTATFGGIERIRFVRRDYDSLIGQAWEPVTNDYTLLELTNSAIVPRHVQRIVPRPDFLFTAADLVANLAVTYSNTVANSTETLSLTETVPALGKSDVIRTINYNQTARPGNTAGPGTIESPLVLPTLMIFNKIGPLFENDNLVGGTNGFFMTDQNQHPFLALSWGSFDGSTNAPEVYPNGTTIAQLESLETGPAIITSGLPNATVGATYSAQFTAIGGQPGYTWALAPNSAGLPSGLNLSSDGKITGIPTSPAAIYDFSVRVTDSLGAFKDLPFTISIF
jgi:hypothetical protein